MGRQGCCETDDRECLWVENSFRCTGSQGQRCLLSAVAREMRWGHMMQIIGLPPVLGPSREPQSRSAPPSPFRFLRPVITMGHSLCLLPDCPPTRLHHLPGLQLLFASSHSIHSHGHKDVLLKLQQGRGLGDSSSCFTTWRALRGVTAT